MQNDETEQDVVGCQTKYECCNGLLNSTGCCHECCKHNLGSDGCQMRCQKCHHKWGDTNGCAEDGVHDIIDNN